MSSEILRHLHERAARDLDFRRRLETAPCSVLDAYALTEEERREIILPNFSWWIDGKIAASARPRTADAFALLRASGIRALLSVTVDPLPGTILRQFGLRAQHYSVDDAPSLDQINQALTTVDRWLSADIPLLIHCDAGKGRTGTVLACYLVAHGFDSQAAIDRVRARRPGSIELTEQEDIIAEYARAVGLLSERSRNGNRHGPGTPYVCTDRPDML